MSRELSSLAEAAASFGQSAVSMHLFLHDALERVMVRIEKTAADSIGTYQPASGGFPAWAPLAPSTLAAKAAAGYATPSPLRASGAMEASFGHEVNGLDGIAGATDPKMVFHETGTEKMPARPVWGPAGFNNRAAIERLIGAAVMAGISGPGDRLSLREDGSEGFRYQIRV